MNLTHNQMKRKRKKTTKKHAQHTQLRISI